MSANRCFEEFKTRVKAQGGTVLEPEWRGKDTRHRAYLNTLPRTLAEVAATELLEYQPERMEDFLNYLRLR